MAPRALWVAVVFRWLVSLKVTNQADPSDGATHGDGTQTEPVLRAPQAERLYGHPGWLRCVQSSFVYGHRAWLRRVRSPFGGRRLRSLFRVRESDSGLGCRGHGALPISDRLVATQVMSAGLADAIFAAALGWP